jgi:large subunit ribosomal protein L30
MRLEAYAMVTIKLVRSRYGIKPSQRKTLEALGLRKIRQERRFEDSPSLRGQIEKVQHLVEVNDAAS